MSVDVRSEESKAEESARQAHGKADRRVRGPFAEHPVSNPRRRQESTQAWTRANRQAKVATDWSEDGRRRRRKWLQTAGRSIYSAVKA